MAEWKQAVEEGQVFWINENLGNIAKVGNKYICLFPKVISFGSFESLEEAKNILESQNIKVELSKYLDLFNQKLLLKEIK